MNDLEKRILELLREGKSLDDAKSIILDEFGKENKATDEEILEAVEKCQKMVDMDKKAADKKALEADTKAFNEKVEAEAKKQVEKILEQTKVKGVLELAAKNDGQVIAKEQDEQWIKDCADMLKFGLKLKSDGLSGEDQSSFDSLKQKSIQVWGEHLGVKSGATLDGIIAQTDAAGGYHMRPEFDMKLDTLLYADSRLLEVIGILRGAEKMLVNGVSTINLTYRTDENTAYTRTRPTYAQEEINPRDAGAIVPISRAYLNGTAYNLMTYLLGLFKDAKIRLLEDLFLIGKTTGDPFNGIWFTPGIGSVDAKNKGGTGKIESSDLTNSWANLPAQSRKSKSTAHIMDTREILVMQEERSTTGAKIDAVKMENGKFIHVPTGKEIIPVDTLDRTLNAYTDKTTGTDVLALTAVLERFRYYEVLGTRIDTSKEIYFDEDQLGVRFTLRNQLLIPANSLTSFCGISGVKQNAIV
jgi:HK97 family phage major capsid protein